MTTILITGGAGFIGSNFIHYIIKHYPDYRIINFDALTYAGNLANLDSIKESDKYRFIHTRIESTESLNIELENETVDYIINFAAESHVDRSIISSHEFVMTNIVGTQVLLDYAKKVNVKKFVHISTDEVYGALTTTEPAFVESLPLLPNSPYAASKAGADLLVRSYFETHSLPVSITRCSNNYGPYQFPEKLIPLMIDHALNDKKLPVYGEGLNIRDWIYVEDHCRGIDAVLHKGQDGEIYNFGGYAELTNIDLVKKILEKLNKPESLITFVTDRLGHDFRYAMNCEKALDTLGWSPKVSFEEGLDKTISWYLTNKNWMSSVKSGDYQTFYKKQYGGRI